MRWRQYWPESVLLAFLLSFQASKWIRNATVAATPITPGWTAERKLAVRETTRELWYHGYKNYMDFAFPLDELTPLSCSGQGPNWEHPEDIAVNDVAGNFSLTLIDVLDTLVVLDDRPGFEQAVKNVIEWVSFDVNTRPQVFETNIRVLGGLLSGHIFASREGHPFHLQWYKGELLDMALDLAERLLPSFSTPTGMPYARVNLRHGVLKGEGIDSCDVEFLDVWDDSYAAIMRWSRSADGFWYRPVNIYSGELSYYTIDSLAAFWPGLQGIDQDRERNQLQSVAAVLWPAEVYDSHFKQATSFQYPLRPEFIESTWYLYRATGDSFYLDVGERVLNDIVARSKVPCGLTGIKDLRDNTRDDRMESFALSETLKYLFLLFDEDNPLHHDDSPWVFTTEGHILMLDKAHEKPISPSRRKMRNIENHQCPAYKPPKRAGLTMGILSRGDVDYARELLGQSDTDDVRKHWSLYGWCERPNVNLFAYDYVLSPHGKVIAEDLSPSRLKLDIRDDGFILHNVTGVRIHIVQRLDGRGYDVRKLGHYDVRAGHLVYINDTTIFGHPDGTKDSDHVRPLDMPMRFHIESASELGTDIYTGHPDLLDTADVFVSGYTALFGAVLASGASSKGLPLRMDSEAGLAVARDPSNHYGCEMYDQAMPDVVVLVQRGECTFLEKLLMAKAAGAAGVLVVSTEQVALNPTADRLELEKAGDLSDVGLLVLPPDVGLLVYNMLDRTEERGGQVVLQLDPEQLPLLPEPAEAQTAEAASPKIMYLNGLPLLNTRLLI
ncbi:unnamed protein product [Mycena citricolor]|uniref:alpha-1,2-Mannosidase n=1 Tax=Mycena citricolor TaxID=2018698 RepID=A0AAD2HII6_9AGAR|nr:unnamed protein product [Mycena citricolor]